MRRRVRVIAARVFAARAIAVRAIAIGALLLSVGGAARAQFPDCTDAQAKRAEKDIGAVRTWDALYKSYKQYEKCDDGDVADAYSDAVATLLVEHWSTLPRLAQLAKKNDDFWQFVLDHIDSSDDPGDLRAIRRRAERRCPAGLLSTCRDLKKAADSAIEELGSDQSQAELQWPPRSL